MTRPGKFFQPNVQKKTELKSVAALLQERYMINEAKNPKPNESRVQRRVRQRRELKIAMQALRELQALPQQGQGLDAAHDNAQVLDAVVRAALARSGVAR